MTPSSLLPRGRRSLSALVVVGLLAVIAALGLQTASASKDAPAVPAPPTQPTRADQIQNIDQVKTAIKAYYGDTIQGTTPFGTPNHVPAADGAYAHEVTGLAKNASKYLAHPSHGKGKHDRGAKAILLDVDDTSLNTYNYEIYSNFVYDPTSNGRFVDAAAFPAVPAMADLAQKAKRDGYTVFFLTGRPEAQRPGTEQNLTEEGFPVRTDRVFLKDDAGQAWITCDTRYTQYDTAADRTKPPACSTIERKSQTRRHIEQDLGYDIAANFGDQFSDLTGGYADRTFKLPNPMYYLP